MLTGVYRCVQVLLATYVGDFAFDVLQQVFLPSDKERMLELCVVSLRFEQATLLDVDHLPETVLSHRQETSYFSSYFQWCQCGDM